MKKKYSMKIVIATSGRAHLLDCARELENQGHEVTFFTYSPSGNFKEFGLKSGGRSLLYLMAPFELLKRKFYNLWTWRLANFMLDLFVSFLMPKCDVFIAQSPYFSRSMLKARKKYKSIIIIDRGTSHVLKYNSILEKIGVAKQWQWYINYDEQQYSLADFIAVASDFVKNSFVEYGISERKLFFNPYGVSLKCFNPTVWTCEFDCVCVGQWSKRKGSHLVVEAFKDTKVRVLHVGAIVDVEFPNCDNFVHVDSVPEAQLPKYYSKAKIFLFPSFEDGFGLVLCQAVACGLPIICSTNTGGPTLKRLLNVDKEILVMESLTPDSLRENYFKMQNFVNSDIIQRNYVDKQNLQDLLSWNAYGERYNNFLNKINKDI